MNRLHSNDNEREQARQLRSLLLLIDGDTSGADHALGADILNALDAPIGIGDPVTCMDCAIHLANWMKQPQFEVLQSATAWLRERVRGGWKCSNDIDGPDVARAITAVLLKVKLANLERAPA
jgi:hypothetical protein